MIYIYIYIHIYIHIYIYTHIYRRFPGLSLEIFRNARSTSVLFFPRRFLVSVSVSVSISVPASRLILHRELLHRVFSKGWPGCDRHQGDDSSLSLSLSLSLFVFLLIGFSTYIISRATCDAPQLTINVLLSLVSPVQGLNVGLRTKHGDPRRWKRCTRKVDGFVRG